MKPSLIATLRDRSATMEAFREASDKLSKIIAYEISNHVKEEHVVLIPILRAGMALLPSFMNFFNHARVGFIGIHRDKEARPHLYYEKLPPLTINDSTIILDPMVATGGSTLLTLDKLIEHGANPNKMTVVGMIGAPEGVEAIQSKYPSAEVIIAAIDEGLDHKKYIVPGLGDFGDRFFGC